jgi:UDP-glucose 4-epimerase
MSKKLRLISITGGSGFVGSSIAKHLAEKGFRVRIIDVKDPGIHSSNTEFVKCDIRDRDAVKKAIAESDVVIYSAIIQIPAINENKRLAYDVNIRALQNVCEVVDKLEKVKGLILTGSWHVFGERGLNGSLDEAYGYRPDKIEDGARLYAISKMIQESVVRLYDEMSEKIFAIIRMGTVLGEGMPEKTAASIFIEKGLNGLPITPYKHSMHRPMLYVDIRDICRAFESFINKILSGEVVEDNDSLHHIVNVMYPEPVTIIELAEMVKSTITKLTKGKISPQIEVVDKGLPSLFSQYDKKQFKVNINKAIKLLGLKRLISPKKSIEYIAKKKTI